ncbi:hypothetical protein Turpa_2644 [Turneriella parva DSM 21527]|uniref:LamG-like jellyroll fold domain-containing protein n=2 Tax=Turneriella TaxID=338321 RepID=I4B7M7_TURPD|nr:hypothetical protein Turpa_2644 [Turneriella parva DSM 21527]
MLGNLYIDTQAGPMSKKLRNTSMWVLAALLGLLAANCSKPVPGEKEMLGKIKGKASLRLADGSTISQPGTDEYSPYLVKLSDGYLALVFGSNQGGLHDLYVAKSTTAFDGEFLPFFNTPQKITSGIGAGSKISFAAKASGTNVVVYVNYTGISSATVDPTNPGSSSLSPITNNTATVGHTIIGISGDGNKLFSTDGSGIGHSFDPGGANVTPFGYGMDNATSATQVRQENSGYEDAIIGVFYGSTFAAAGQQYFGPIFDLDTSLAFSGLSITSMSTFNADSAANDLVLFSAFDFFDGFTEDLYVITSHTSKDLWDSAGFLGLDFSAALAPPPDHWFDMFAPATSCPNLGFSMTPWSAICTAIGDSSTGSYDGTEAGEFDGSTSNMTILGQDPGNFFTIAAWVNITSVTACSTSCVIVANSGLGASTDGFRLYVDATGAVNFETGNGTLSLAISTPGGLISDVTWNHVMISVDRLSGLATLYVNGFEEGTTNAIRTDFNTNATLTFGAPDGGANPITGLMDEIKIYNFPVDATLAQLIYYE